MALRLSLLIAALFVVSASAQIAADKRVTPADILATTGVAVHQVAPGAIPGAGPGVNFANPDNKMLVMVNFGGAELYRRAKEQKEMTIGGTKMPMVLFHKDVRGIGDEAFDSPPGDMQYVLFVRKGAQAITVSTFFGKNMKPMLTMAQLEALAKIIVMRL